MATYDLGDPVALSVTIRDAAGALANATTVTLTVTLPDGTTAAPTVTTGATGVYTATYIPTVAGLHGVLWTATGANASAYRDSFTVMAAVTPLVSLDDIKARLNITNTASDEELRRIAAAATARAEQYTGRALAPRTLTQNVDMTYRAAPSVTVPQPSLLTVTALTDGGAAVSDYEVSGDGQTIRRPNGTSFAGTVAITGTIGVAGGDLATAQQAVLELTAHLWETQRTPMGGRNPMAAGPVPGMGYALPNRVTEMLEPLVLRGFA